MVESRRILVIEDDPLIAGTLQDLFRMLSLDRNLRMVPDAKTGLAALRREPFDLVILDLIMPGMSGTDLLAILNDDPVFKGLRILVNSTQTDKQTLEKIGRCSNLAIEFVARPFDPMALMEKIKQVCASN